MLGTAPAVLEEIVTTLRLDGAANHALTFVDHFAGDVIFTHSAIFQCLHEHYPELIIRWVHAGILARELKGSIPEANNCCSLIPFGIFEQVGGSVSDGAEEVLSGPKTAFVITFYEASFQAVSRSSSSLARTLGDFFDAAQSRGHVVICCLHRPLLSIEPLEFLFFEKTTVLCASNLYDSPDTLPSPTSLSAIPGPLQRFFCTSSKSLSRLIDSILAGLAKPLSDMAAHELIKHLEEISGTLANQGFYEAAFRLEQWCRATSRQENAAVRIALDIYTKEDGPDGALTVGLIDDPTSLPNISLRSCVTGSAGSGKSTALREIHRHWALPDNVGLSARSSSWIPIHLESSSGDLTTALTRCLGGSRVGASLGIKGHGPPLSTSGEAGFVVTPLSLRWLFSSPILLLLDEFDKLDSVERDTLRAQIADFARTDTSASVVIAARTGYAPSIQGFTHATVRALSNHQAAAIIRSLRSSLDFVSLAESRQPGLAALVRNPFLLTMLCKTCSQTHEFAELTMSSLVGNYLKYLLARGGNEDPDHDETVRECIEYWMPKLALAMRARRVTSSLLPPKAHIEFARNVGILRAASGQAGPEFSHSILQDYFVARRLQEEARSAGFGELLPNDQSAMGHWQTVLRILAGLLEPPSFDRLIAFLADVHIELALDCLLHRGTPPSTENAKRVVETLCLRAQLFKQIHLEGRISAATSLRWMDKRIAQPAEALTGMVRVSEKRWRRPELWVGKFPVTNMEYAEFVRSRGYATERFWTSDGWKWRSDNAVEHPFYWRLAELNAPNFPIVGVSFHEALAYCAWLNSLPQHSGRWHFQLPSDEEWAELAFSLPARLLADARTLIARYNRDAAEVPMGKLKAQLENDVEAIVARFDAELSEYSEQLAIRELTPVGVFPPNRKGIFDVFGQVWQWRDSWASTREGAPSAAPQRVFEPVIVSGGPGAHRNSLFLLLGGWFDASTRFDRLGFRVTARPKKEWSLGWKSRRQL